MLCADEGKIELAHSASGSGTICDVLHLTWLQSKAVSTSCMAGIPAGARDGTMPMPAVLKKAGASKPALIFCRRCELTMLPLCPPHMVLFKLPKTV